MFVRTAHIDDYNAMTGVTSSRQVTNRSPCSRQGIHALPYGLFNRPAPFPGDGHHTRPPTIFIGIESQGIDCLPADGIDRKPNDSRTERPTGVPVLFTDTKFQIPGKEIGIVLPIGQFTQPCTGQRSPKDRTGETPSSSETNFNSSTCLAIYSSVRQLMTESGDCATACTPAAQNSVVRKSFQGLICK